MVEPPEIAGELLADPKRGWPDDGRPLTFVDLAAMSEAPESLPPYPVIGLGGTGHPSTNWCDCVLESPATAQSLRREVERHPRAAAVLVQLLRMSGDLPAQEALFAESLAYGLLQGSAEHEAWLGARDPEVPAAPGTLKVERDGDIVRLRIDRAAARNAIDRPLRDALFDAFALAGLDGDIVRVELTAEGPAFSIGGDLAEFGTTRDPATAHLIRARTLPAMPLLRCADRLHVHVRGACVGAGLEIAAFARHVTATRNAWFQLPELSMGLIPGAGGCVSVPRRIGRQRAALMILSGKRISAPVALDWGLIDAIEDAPPFEDGGPDLSGA